METIIGFSNPTVGIPDWVRQRFIESASPRRAPLPPPPAPPAPTPTTYCRRIIMLATPESPPEYCDEEAVDDLELCQEHADLEEDSHWDMYRERHFH